MNQMTRRFIFLDIDGVINTSTHKEQERMMRRSTSSYYITLPNEKIALLQYMVSRTAAEIVICSSWRLGWTKYGPSRAYLNFQNQVNSFGIQLLGWTPSLGNGKNRGAEIKLWLDRFASDYGYYPPYIIVDNEISSLKYHHRGHIIETQEYEGLTPKITNIAINVLLNQLKEECIRYR